MAYVMPVNPPIDQMTRILNVEQRVGPHPNCPNLASDVEAVQRLIAIAVRTFSSSHGFGPPVPTGRYDPITGFYVYYMQEEDKKRHGGVVVDGTISPAHGQSYGGGVWSIVNFNNIAYFQSRADWEALLARYPIRSS